MTTPPSPPSSAPDRPRLPWDPPDHFEKRVPEGDNRERLVCARCEFIHYQKPKIVAGAGCTWNDKILMAVINLVSIEISFAGVIPMPLSGESRTCGSPSARIFSTCRY